MSIHQSKETLEYKFDSNSFMLNMTHDEDRRVSLRETEQFTDIDLEYFECTFKKEQSSVSKSDNGILIHSLCDLFQQINELKTHGIKVYLTCSYFEIYND